MHIPDGLLASRVYLPLGGVTLAAIGFAASRARRDMEERPGVLALTGVIGAFILAAQMVNFPVLPGVSGHLLGGVLAGVLLGPHLATLAMVAVFVFQAFVQQDGGVLALGANAFNMGLIATFLGNGVFRSLRAALGGGPGRATLAAAFVASLLSVLLGALACFLEVAASDPRYAGKTFLALMLGHHAVIGLVEGAITVAVLAYVGRTRPDLLDRDARAAASGAAPRTWPLAVQFLVAAAITGFLLARFASELPDGFEAAQEGAVSHAEAAPGGPSQPEAATATAAPERR